MLKRDKFSCYDKEEILIDVNIITENRKVGIVKIHGLPGKNNNFTNACLFSAFVFVFYPAFFVYPIVLFAPLNVVIVEIQIAILVISVILIVITLIKKLVIAVSVIVVIQIKNIHVVMNRCCYGLCEKSSCPCCDENRC